MWRVKMDSQLVEILQSNQTLTMNIIWCSSLLYVSLFVFPNPETCPGHFHWMSVVYQPSHSISLSKDPFAQLNFLPFSSIFQHDKAPPSRLFSGHQSLSHCDKGAIVCSWPLNPCSFKVKTESSHTSALPVCLCGKYRDNYNLLLYVTSFLTYISSLNRNLLLDIS